MRQVLEGYADAYVFPQNGTKKWDTCAVDALLHAAGGFMGDAYGERIRYDKNVALGNDKGVLGCAPGCDHKRFVLDGSKIISKY